MSDDYFLQLLKHFLNQFLINSSVRALLEIYNNLFKKGICIYFTFTFKAYVNIALHLVTLDE